MARSDVLEDNLVPKSVEGSNLSEGREDAGKKKGGGIARSQREHCGRREVNFESQDRVGLSKER